MMPLSPLSTEDLDYVSNLTKDLWAEMQGQSIFITGGTGFFGLWLLETFCNANSKFDLNAKATILTRNPNRLVAKAPHLAGNSAVTLLEGDVRDFDFPEEEHRYVIHAGTTSSEPVEPNEMFSTIVDGTRRVLRFALANNAKKFLFVSSGAVYGRQPAELTHMPEEYSGAPDFASVGAAYGEGKRVGELLCSLMASGTKLECKIARCFAFVGPHLPLDSHFAIGNFIRDAMHGGPIRVAGDGTPTRSYLYAADLAAWLWRLLFKGNRNNAYNVGSDEPISILELAGLVAFTILGNAENMTVGKPNNSPEKHQYIPSNSKFKKEFGVTNTIALVDAISRTARWHKHLPAEPRKSS